jgi:hypothetical protein
MPFARRRQTAPSNRRHPRCLSPWLVFPARQSSLRSPPIPRDQSLCLQCCATAPGEDPHRIVGGNRLAGALLIFGGTWDRGTGSRLIHTSGSVSRRSPTRSGSICHSYQLAQLLTEPSCGGYRRIGCNRSYSAVRCLKKQFHIRAAIARRLVASQSCSRTDSPPHI